jgi:hypothetical protein
MASNTITFVENIVKHGQLLQKSKSGHTYTDNMVISKAYLSILKIAAVPYKGKMGAMTHTIQTEWKLQ